MRILFYQLFLHIGGSLLIVFHFQRVGAAAARDRAQILCVGDDIRIRNARDDDGVAVVIGIGADDASTSYPSGVVTEISAMGSKITGSAFAQAA